MAKKAPLSAEEAAELFSRLNESGLLDEEPAGSRAAGSRASDAPQVDPLSNRDPSGSKAADAISVTAVVCIALILVLVVGTQVGFGVARRLNTANLSETVDEETVQLAMESGVEWGGDFTQFPADFSVDEASENTGIVEVSVLDTDSQNELELLSNSQIQASALATNALLNDKIYRVVYNVYALVDESGDIQYDRFLGLVPASGTKTAMFTFIWTKPEAGDSTSLDWELKIIGLDESTTEAIQEQVNSVSSVANDSTATQTEIEAEEAERELEKRLHGQEVFVGASDDEDDESLVEELSEALSGSEEDDADAAGSLAETAEETAD